jgi:membrane dipeptidase
MILDAHLDLAMNALEWNRDLSRPIDEIRARERGMADRPDRGRGTVSFDELRRGGIGVVVATQIARYVKRSNPLPGWHSPEQAWAMTQGQLAWYRDMERRGEMRAILARTDLDEHVAAWGASADPLAERLPIGYVRSLEGADSIVTLHHLQRAWDDGLRAVGPAHYGPGTYAQGTDATGGMGDVGRSLLGEMDRLGMILDATHLCDDSFWEALDHFGGRVWASHNNCRALVPHNRQFSDDQIRALASRGAVIGVALDAWMLYPGWRRGVTTPEAAGVTLSTLVDHIDYICQLTGNAVHVGIGSDLDGAFGREQTASDLETIADLTRVLDILARRGYAVEDIAAIASGNFVRFLRDALPASLG